MPDDAQQPASDGEAAGRTDPRAAVTGESAPGRGTPGQGPGPASEQEAGPGTTVASGEAPAWPAASAWPAAPPVTSAPSVHDQQTITSLPAMGDGSVPPSPAPLPSPPATPHAPWATPAAPPQVSGGGAPAAYGGAHAAPPYPGGGAVPPFAPPYPGGGAPHAFAPPAEPVPPPPIAPDGPGQVPYGYPGGYGYPGAAGPGAGPATGYGTSGQQGYYGWGAAPLPSNGPGTAGLVLGIVSAVMFCLWPAAIVVGALAVIFGGVGRAKSSRGEATNGGQALAGIICGSAGIVLGAGFGLIVLLT